jgi:SAM-dependent methyltransferase
MSPESIAYRDQFIKKTTNKMIKQDCKVCMHVELNLIGEIDKFGFYYPTSVCDKCGNVQQLYYYDNNTLVDFYSNYYRKIYGAIDPDVHFKLQKKKRGLKILNFIKQYSKPKTVLEIGCGAGGILSRFLDDGYTVLGLDFDDEHLEAARRNKISVIKGSIEKLSKDDKFDLIILSHVLEHIVKPSEFLENLSKHLSDDGIIYIEVPSLDNISDGGHNFDLLHYWEIAHISHFTVESLKLLCKTVGLKPIKITKSIESCWKFSSFSKQLSETEKQISFDHTKKLLLKIEKNRTSFKDKMIPIKAFISSAINKSLSVLGMKDIVRSLYFKVRGK